MYHDKDGLNHDKNGVLGLGLRPVSQPSSGGEKSVASTSYDVKDAEKRIYGPLTSKATTYLSQFILHIAAIGDIVDGTDTTHDFNYFSLIYEWPKDVLLHFPVFPSLSNSLNDFPIYLSFFTVTAVDSFSV